MNWKDIGSTIGKFAPMVGTALLGPAGGIVGSLVSSALGVENEPESVAKAMQTDPQAGLKLKQLQIDNQKMLNEHIEKMANLEFKYEESRVAEVSSAREREIKTTASGSKNYVQGILGIVGVIAFFGFSGYIVVIGLPEMGKDSALVVGTVIGSVMMIGKDIYGYYFGSSSGSKDKTKLLKG